MAFTIRGKNFQAHEDFHLEASGLTVIIGDSNEGKSSIFRALRGLVRNELGAHYLKIGSKKMEVTLEIEGHTYSASRTRSGSTKYLIDGSDKFTSVGSNIPEPVASLGLGEIELGKEAIDPVFAPQGSGQFLIEEKAPALNAVLGAFSSTERLERGKREANSQASKLNSEASTLARQLQQVEERKARLAALSSRALDIRASLSSLEKEVSRQESLVSALEDLIRSATALDRLREAVSRVAVPSTTDAERQLRTLIAASQATAAAEQSARLRTVVSGLVVPDTSALPKALDTVIRLDVLIPEQQRLKLNKAWFERVAAMAQTWSQIVSDYALFKAVRGAHDQVLALQGTSASKIAEVIGEKQQAVEAALQRIDLLLGREKLLAQLAAAMESALALRGSLVEVDAHRTTLQSRADFLEAEFTVQRELEYRIAHQVTCPGCGEQFIPDSEEGEHHHAISGSAPTGFAPGSVGSQSHRRAASGAPA